MSNSAKVKKVMGFECPCGNVVPIDDAQEHATCFITEEIDIFQCSECTEWYDDREDAKECCEV